VVESGDEGIRFRVPHRGTYMRGGGSSRASSTVGAVGHC